LAPAGPYFADWQVAYHLLEERILVEEGRGAHGSAREFAANSPEGVERFQLHLGKIDEIGLTLHLDPNPLMGRYWLFVLRADGSGWLHYGTEGATFPAGTVDFRRVREHLLALPEAEEPACPYLYLDMSCLGSTYHIYKRAQDVSIVRELFPAVLAALEG